VVVVVDDGNGGDVSCLYVNVVVKNVIGVFVEIKLGNKKTFNSG